MPNANAMRVELSIYVEREHWDKVEALLEDPDDDSLLLDIEKCIGRRVAGLPRLKAGVLGGEHYDYGEGVAEVYQGGIGGC